MPPPLQLDHQATLTLRYAGDCGLLGMTPDGVIYAEEIYDEDGWAAQHALSLDGTFLQSVDEERGRRDLLPLVMPPDTIRPAPVRLTTALNFSGPRLRGMREDERVHDVVRPLELTTRMTLINRLRLVMSPMALLGLAESIVLAEAQLTPEMMLVCRRLRIAYALPQPERDSNNQPYDYDTLTVYAAHLAQLDTLDELSPDMVLDGLPGVTLNRPTDCLRYKDIVLVADSGSNSTLSAIHVWRYAAIET